MAHAFLDHLQDTLELDGRYADPDLSLQAHPAAIGNAMLDQIEAMIARIRWDRRDVAEFAGRYLTEPKPHVFFDAPEAPPSFAVFARQAQKHGVKLDLKSRMLFRDRRFFINGDGFTAGRDEVAALRALADRRRLAAPLPEALLPRLHEWQEDGWIHIDRKGRA
jgi:50S ribosomal protein L16 3-hydroxylase